MNLEKRIFLYIFGGCSVLSILAVLFMLFFTSANLLVLIFLVILLLLLSLCFSFVLSKKLSGEFKPLWEDLNSQTEKIDKEMKKIKRENKRQDKIRREFTANVSHELKTPLTSISGYAEIMKNGMVKPEDVTRFSTKIYDEAQRMITLVGDIIKLSRLDENAVEEKKERIELYSLCETIISRLESTAMKNDVTFELLGQHAEINGIARIIDEMIYNLCDNAIKYNKQGGKVTVAIKQTATDIILSVADTGIGIEKEDQKRVFERFYRVNKSRSQEIGGTGLGLSIVKHGAVIHNAKLKVDSQVDKGTTISIIFS